MHRRTVLTAAALGLTTAAVTAVPAVAATTHGNKPTDRPTSITLKAAHATVAPKHKTTLTAKLKSGHTAISGEELYLEQRTGHRTWSDPTPISATDQDGKVTIPVTPGNHKGTKEQYRVVFPGDTGYKKSHSGIITVTVS